MEQREIKAALGRTVVCTYQGREYHGTLSAVRIQRDGDRYVYSAEVLDRCGRSVLVADLESVRTESVNAKNN